MDYNAPPYFNPRVFCMTEAEKACELNLSTGFLQKDRRKAEPQFEFRRYGRVVRYAPESGLGSGRN